MKKIKQFNKFLLGAVIFLFGYYIFQTISISSGNVALVSLKRDFLEKKNSLNSLVSGIRDFEGLGQDFIRNDLGMTEIEKFDYMIVGPSEFAKQ